MGGVRYLPTEGTATGMRLPRRWCCKPWNIAANRASDARGGPMEVREKCGEGRPTTIERGLTCFGARAGQARNSHQRKPK